MYKMNMAERRPGVKDFSYTDDLLDELEASLSRECLGTYLYAAGTDREGAIRLYAWNTAVSAAFYGPLQGLEVALRNAMHRGLAERYGEAWYDNRDAGLDRGAMERIASARTELARRAWRRSTSDRGGPFVRVLGLAAGSGRPHRRGAQGEL